ncbi:MAG: tetratricopeptide repeat protein [Nitrospirota bacterium]
MKGLLSLFLLFMLSTPTLSLAKDLVEEQLDRGIRNSEPYSYSLIRQSRTNNAEAQRLLKEALRYSPDLPAVYFELSKASFSFSSKGFFETVDYMLRGIAAYRQNFWWSFTMIGSLFISLVLSFIVSMIIIIIIRLPHDLPLLSHDIKELRAKALLLIVLFSAIISPLFLIGSALIIIGLYFKKWDRIVVYLYLLFLLALPWVLNISSMFINALASSDLKAIVQVNESKGNRYALSVLKETDDNVARFSYALALKREGRYDEAINILNKLISDKADARLYNNLANCYAAKNNMERAKEFYKKSIELKPLTAALYNLSQISRETFDFITGEEFFLSAQRQDAEAVSRFMSIFGRNPNRFVIDENLPLTDLWKYAKEKISDSTFGLSVIQPAFIPGIASFLITLFLILNIRIRNRAYKCRKCGAILCNKCEKRIIWGHMCIQCFGSLIKLDELNARERVARLLTVYEHQKKRRSIIKLITFIIPGSGQIYAGNILKGLLFLWLFLFFLFILVMNSILVPETSFFSHLWLNGLSLFLMAVVYFAANILTRGGIAAGWL